MRALLLVFGAGVLGQLMAADPGATKDGKLSVDDYTHVSVDPTMQWNRESTLLHFQVFATPRELAEGKPTSHPRVARWVDYDPKKNRILLK
jgi:hypothetical protein